MLNKIIVKNVSAIEVASIDFKKKNYKFLENNLIGDSLNPIAIYGHNGSGKSSFFQAIKTLIILMTEPLDNLRPFIVNDFLFQEFSKNPEPRFINKIIGSVELQFKINDVDYVYFISTSTRGVIEKEFLECGKNPIFKRVNANVFIDGNYINIESSYQLLPYLRILASEEVADRKIQDAFSYISSLVFVDLPNIALGGFVTSKHFRNMQTYDLMASKSEEIKEVLKSYDEFPIYSVMKNDDNSNIIGNNQTKYSIVFEGMEDKKIPIEFMSAGMRNQSLLLGIVLSVPSNSVVFVDELERALHPSALESFLNVVRKKKIQLVFSSHNTSILQTMRPDQIYFAKWNNGFSNMYRLSNIYPAIREINNIEKMYLSGLFKIEE